MSERSVRTDALETLGMIHEREEKRDAIHLAVIPAVAGERLLPGTHVGVSKDGKAYVTAPEYCVGIVDPFLLDAVVHRERFWLVIYPRKITSLRHVWSHPAFPDEPSVSAPASPTEPSGSAVAVARARIRDMAADLDCSVDRLMDGAAEYIQDGVSLHFGFDLDYDWPAEEFWRCYELVTGKAAPPDKPFFFRCSC